MLLCYDDIGDKFWDEQRRLKVVPRATADFNRQLKILNFLLPSRILVFCWAWIWFTYTLVFFEKFWWVFSTSIKYRQITQCQSFKMDHTYGNGTKKTPIPFYGTTFCQVFSPSMLKWLFTYSPTHTRLLRVCKFYAQNLTSFTY